MFQLTAQKFMLQGNTTPSYAITVFGSLNCCFKKFLHNQSVLGYRRLLRTENQFKNTGSGPALINTGF